MFARVVLDASTGRQFDYRIPEVLMARIGVGARVRVPLRTRMVLGTVVEVSETTAAKGIRDVHEVLGEKPLMHPVLLRLGTWIADYYCCSEETALRAVLPQVIRKAEVGHKKRAFVSLAREVSSEEIANLTRRAPRQAELILRLKACGEPVEAACLGSMRAAVRPLECRGIVRLHDRIIPRDPEGTYMPAAEHALNAEQSAAFERVKAAIESPESEKPILLYGVTGSGKTEVYLQAIRYALDRGMTAIVLVPEISLTPQTVDRFKSRFAAIQGEVAVMHSRLSAGERHDEWHKVHSGGAKIVIGARSAVFAPLTKLGLIVVDEEHELTYKQEEAPHYHARDIAVLRANIEPCAILLGSATPSLESYYNATSGKYALLRLTVRVDDRRMPVIRVVDMRHQKRRAGTHDFLSPMLCRAIEGRLARREQVILFLNRRGYAPAVICPVCGHVCQCPNCSVALTYHRDANRILCHICGHAERAPGSCPACHEPGIRHAGVGTQRVEEVVRKFFPLARVERMDADSMARRGAYRETLGRFKAGQIDVLVGTQMIAKGLHFPNVTLVGIINADIGLHVADFRAGERTFQLLTQVAGRAGRGDLEGEVLVQTFTPFSPSIQFARHHDFEGFWDQESELRRKVHYPPYDRFSLLTIRSANPDKAGLCADTIHRRLKELLPPSALLGDPTPAPLARARGQHRLHLALRGPSSPVLSRLVRAVLNKLTLPKDVHVTVDIDAYHLL